VLQGYCDTTRPVEAISDTGCLVSSAQIGHNRSLKRCSAAQPRKDILAHCDLEHPRTPEENPFPAVNALFDHPARHL